MSHRSFLLTSFSALAVCLLGLKGSVEPTEFIRLPAYSEGPVFDGSGNLYVSYGKTSVAKAAPDGSWEDWFVGENPNGHKILEDGTHLLCVKGAVLQLSSDGEVLQKASSHCKGQPLRAPNDLTLRPAGGFYFTDPGGSREAPIGTVHFVDTEGATHLVAGGLWVPNGLVLSPDGRRLYVAETVPNRVLWFEVKADGKLGPLNVFATLPSRFGHQAEPDGMLVDEEGRLYVAHLGMSSVQVFNPMGRLLKTLPAGNYDASNLVFGGPDHRKLYITGSIGHRSNSPGRVYSLDLKQVEWDKK